jgi:hypothetical protein
MPQVYGADRTNGVRTISIEEEKSSSGFGRREISLDSGPRTPRSSSMVLHSGLRTFKREREGGRDRDSIVG